MFQDDPGTLCHLMEGLFHIAVADGAYHPAEDDFLSRVAGIFRLDDRDFRSLRARFAPGREPDAWDVLGVDPGTPLGGGAPSLAPRRARHAPGRDDGPRAAGGGGQAGREAPDRPQPRLGDGAGRGGVNRTAEDPRAGARRMVLDLARPLPTSRR